MSVRPGGFVRLVPVHIGHDAPSAGVFQSAEEAGSGRTGRWRSRRATLQDPSIGWQRHGLEPRWLGMESSDCAAAINPGIFHNRGADELNRFLAGAKARNEIALIVATMGDIYDDAPRSPLASADDSILLPGLEGSISGIRLPAGARASLASDLSRADRDLGLRLLNRPADGPWWSLGLSSTTSYPGAGGPPTLHEPDGHLEPILVDGLDHPVVAAWVPATGDQRWYVIPDAMEWDGILGWLVEHALPLHVPGALRRARSPHSLDPALQTPAEVSARRALDDLDAEFASERHRLEGELERASAAAEALRYGLLYGTGAELEKAVAVVLAAAGFETVVVDDLLEVVVDDLLGDTTSADLLASYEQERRLVEVKSASGRAAEALVGHLQRHLETWPQLRPGEPVGGGVLVINHQYRLEPHERAREVYSRQEFVAALNVPVLATSQLFEWWRTSDWTAIREAVLARPGVPGEDRASNTATSLPTQPPTPPSGSVPSARRWPGLLGRRRSTD
jgi:hypothetical protein